MGPLRPSSLLRWVAGRCGLGCECRRSEIVESGRDGTVHGERRVIGRVMRLGILVAVFATVGLSVAKAPAPMARQGLLSLENARLFYEVTGSGEPIVIVQRWPRAGPQLPPAGHGCARGSKYAGVLRPARDRPVGCPARHFGGNLDAFVSDIDALPSGARVRADHSVDALVRDVVRDRIRAPVSRESEGA